MYCDECGFKNKETAKFCKKCGASLEEEREELTKKEDVQKILEEEFATEEDEMKLTKKQLLDYLNTAKELEVNKLGLENSITDLHNLDKKEHARIVRPIEKKKFEFHKSGNWHDMIFVLSLFLAVISFVVLTFVIWHTKYGYSLSDMIFNVITIIGALFKDSFWVSMLMAAGISIGGAVVINVISFVIKIIYDMVVNKPKLKIKKEEYNKECEKIDEENNNQLVLYQGEKDIIDGRLECINKDLEDTEKTLKKYYDLDVIYPKYRNLIAITTFIEYLESGRCKSLYGYTGCYNVYEQELRQNVIIGKLDQVLVKLDEIKKAQYATFLAIQMSNAIQSAFVNTCNDMLNEQKRANAAIEAEAQDMKIIKRNNEIMTTISTLNYVKHK